jgi:hypothetical protein
MAGTPKKPHKNGKPGPKRNPDLMELAVHLRLRGQSWRQVARAVGVALSTVIDWKDSDEWKAIRERLANGRADRLVHLSFEVLARKLGRELTRANPDTSLAEKLWDRTMGPPPGEDGDYPRTGVPGAMNHIVVLPVMDKGLESKPATQVLIQPPPAEPAPPAAPAPAPGRKAPRAKPSPHKRTAAGPDE